MAFIPWTPADLDTGLNAWFDISDAASITEISGAVSALADKSPNGNTYTQGSAAARPVKIDAELNGLPVLRFDGIDDHLAAPGHVDVGSVTMVMVAKVTAYTDNTYFYVQRRASNTAPIRFVGLSQGNNKFRTLVGDSVVREMNAVDQNWHLFGWKAQAGNHEGFVDGNLETTIANASTGPTDYAAIGAFVGIGAGNSATYGFRAPVDVAEIIILDNETERERVEGYLAWKWGLEASLPLAHPYKDQAPGEFATGGQVTGTVTVNGQPAVRDLIAITYAKQEITPEVGDPFEQRLVVGETTSAEDGTYTLSTGAFLQEVIILAMEDYGAEWKPNRTLVVGDRIRPTQPNQTGYVYEVTIAGNSGATEPEAWLVPTGAITTMDIGTATAIALPMYWSLAHAPVLPESINPTTPWTPTDLSVAPHLWVDASDETTVQHTSGTVSAWNDKSAGANNLALAGTGITTGATQLADKNVLDFAGTGHLATTQIAKPANFTIIAVARLTNLTKAVQGIMGGGPANGSSALGWGSMVNRSTAQGKLETLVSDGTLYLHKRTTAPVIVPNTWQMHSITYTGGTTIEARSPDDSETMEVFIDNGASSNAGATQPYAIGNLGSYLAGANNGYLAGSVAEALVIPAALTEAERQKLEGYLAHKWGLTAGLDAGHPYKTTAPTA
jgi:hypothetical protein